MKEFDRDKFEEILWKKSDERLHELYLIAKKEIGETLMYYYHKKCFMKHLEFNEAPKTWRIRLLEKTYWHIYIHYRDLRTKQYEGYKRIAM